MIEKLSENLKILKLVKKKFFKNWSPLLKIVLNTEDYTYNFNFYFNTKYFSPQNEYLKRFRSQIPKLVKKWIFLLVAKKLIKKQIQVKTSLGVGSPLSQNHILFQLHKV